MSETDEKHESDERHEAGEKHEPDESAAEDAPGSTCDSGADTVPGKESLSRPTGGVAGWPFLVYLAAWVALAAATVFALTTPDAVAVPVNDPRYPGLLLVGITLAALGPVLTILTWAVAFWTTAKGCRGGLLTTALVRGASSTLFGVLVWWGALLLVDALRLGLI